jgi:hypothetical protein
MPVACNHARKVTVTGLSSPGALVQFKPARRLAGTNPLLSLMKGELPRGGELAYFMKNIAARGLCFPASPLRSASGTKGA